MLGRGLSGTLPAGLSTCSTARPTAWTWVAGAARAPYARPSGVSAARWSWPRTPLNALACLELVSYTITPGGM